MNTKIRVATFAVAAALLGGSALAETLPASGVFSSVLVLRAADANGEQIGETGEYDPWIVNDSFVPAGGAYANSSGLSLGGRFQQSAAQVYSDIGSNHGLAFVSGPGGQAHAVSAWYDQVEISDTAGAGTAQFNLRIDGVMSGFNAVSGGNFALYASTLHPTLLDVDGIPDDNYGWEVSAPESQLLVSYSTTITSYDEFGRYGDYFDVALSANLDYTADTPIYLIGVMYVEAFASNNNENTIYASIDVLNSGYITGVSLPEGATATFGSGLDYNNIPVVTISPVLSVPEPQTYAMLLAGLGLVGVAAKRRSQAQPNGRHETESGEPGDRA